MFDFRQATAFCLGYRVSKHKTVSTHIIYSSIFVIIAEKHASVNDSCLQKLGLVKMGYHYMFLILKYF